MAYSILADVKRRIDPEGELGETHDTELTDYIASADALIDSDLEAAGVTVPVNPVPTMIKDVSADYAAAMFQEHRYKDEVSPERYINFFRHRAEVTLLRYVKNKYRQVITKHVTESQLEETLNLPIEEL